MQEKSSKHFGIRKRAKGKEKKTNSFELGLQGSLTIKTSGISANYVIFWTGNHLNTHFWKTEGPSKSMGLAKFLLNLANLAD